MLAFFQSFSWLIIWMACWFGWWGILYIQLPEHNDYVMYTERDIVFFFLGSFIWLIFLPFPIWIANFIALLFLGVVCTSLGSYLWFQKKHDSNTVIKQREKLIKFLTNTQHENSEHDWHELNPRYLFVKATEILFQQLAIIALWHSIVTEFIPTLFKSPIITLVTLFTLVHIPMLLFKTWSYARTFIIASVFGSFIFGFIFDQLSYSGIALTYIFHIFFYVSLPDMAGLFTSVGKKLMRKK